MEKQHPTQRQKHRRCSPSAQLFTAVLAVVSTAGQEKEISDKSWEGEVTLCRVSSCRVDPKNQPPHSANSNY